jgi:plasmid stabilization system protein ParE
VGFRIRFSFQALAGLEEALAYSWAHFPETTEQFATGLFDHIDALQRFPFLGSRVPRRKNTRLLVHSPLFIYYRVWEDDHVVEILEIRHAARR